MAVARQAKSVTDILETLGLSSLEERFRREKADITTLKSLTDSDLIRLGIETIGDRVRLREIANSCKVQDQREAEVPTDYLGPLFNRNSQRFHVRNKKLKSKREKTWTGKFMCLSDRNKETVPSATEKMELKFGGLGIKKVQFSEKADEEKVYSLLCTEFPLIKDCGGVELLRCVGNSRDLQLISCKWDVQSLKSVIGSQATIYIRPVQASIKLDKRDCKTQKSEMTDRCKCCQKIFSITDLRQHYEECSSKTSTTIQK